MTFKTLKLVQIRTKLTIIQLISLNSPTKTNLNGINFSYQKWATKQQLILLLISL